MDLRKKAVIFDLDGTLIDSRKDLFNAVNYALEQSGMPERSFEEVIQFTGNGIEKLIRRSVPVGTEQKEIMHTLSLFKEYYNENCTKETYRYGGTEETLYELRSLGYKLAVISNKDDFLTKKIVMHYFPGLFDIILGATNNLRLKPFPDSIEYCLRLLNVEKEDIYYVGDSETDLEFANNAGVKSVIVSYGFRSKKIMRELGVETFADTAEEILNFIE